MAETSNGILQVGSGVVCKGTLSVPGLASIDGLVEGALTASRLEIGSKGAVNGTVNAAIVKVAGMLADSVQAEQSLVIEPTGQVTGAVSYRSIEVRKGGQLLGDARVLKPDRDEK